MIFSDFGNFKCYQFNGVGEEDLLRDFKTVYIVDTKVDSLLPTPVYWFEYNSLTDTNIPEVYYVKGDPVNIR